MDSQFVARISFKNHSNFLSKIVKLVGIVLNCDSSQAIIETCDKGQICCLLGEVSLRLIENTDINQSTVGSVVEITGRVEQQGKVQELTSSILSGQYNPDNYLALVDLMPKFPEVFGVAV